MKAINQSTLLFGLGLLVMLGLQVEAVEELSSVRYNNFTDDFSAQWVTVKDGTTRKLRTVLRYKQYDIGSWSDQGNNGLWLGIGFGTQNTMIGSDMVMCKYVFSNNTANDNFVCEDRWGQDNAAPTLD